MKRVLLSILTFMCAASLFAAASSSIRISGYADDDEKTVYIYNSDKAHLDEHLKLTGNVSSDCMSVRVIWAPNSFNNIFAYLIAGSKQPGVPIDDFTLKAYKAGSTQFVYNINDTLDNLKFGTNCYLFIAKFSDGSYKTTMFTVYAHQGGMAEKGKPVIYLYPKKTQNVKVSVAPKGGVTVSIPEMGKQWKVKATPEGVITDLKTKEEYPYLFWESADENTEIDMSQGFVTAAGVELDAFFEEKLSALGLNRREIYDFTGFWVPVILKEQFTTGKNYVFVNFYTQERIDREAPLSVSPAPDTVIRVYFDHKMLDAPMEVEPQELSAPERKGFTVVEWGGRLYK